ncbi:hypothetical protein DEO72_LG7g2831 [Vigna unguiculata]|uniref:Uncharacterized protein n=1 Tax=Vigna unguiculata TaxID=3917 RepID=A0A4D6MJG4_VIGUN|nr:hypothetical protein DEO72_LG7g2831 [Vigna unguiculata]
MYFHGAGNSDKGVNPDIGVIPVKNKKQDQENAVFPSCEYKLPLVWIDLEMTEKSYWKDVRGESKISFKTDKIIHYVMEYEDI